MVETIRPTPKLQPPPPTEGIDQLAAALAKAQGKIVMARKGRINVYFDNAPYATLADIWEACRGPLSEHGLAVIQLPQHVEGTEDRMILETILVHESGQRLTSYYPITPVPSKSKDGQVGKITPQSIGSAITYARRYALAAMVGVAPAEEDDDGEAASSGARGGQGRPPSHENRRDPGPRPGGPGKPRNFAAEIDALKPGEDAAAFNEIVHRLTKEPDAIRQPLKPKLEAWREAKRRNDAIAAQNAEQNRSQAPAKKAEEWIDPGPPPDHPLPPAVGDAGYTQDPDAEDA